MSKLNLICKIKIVNFTYDVNTKRKEWVLLNIYFDNSATTMPYNEVIEEVSNGMKEYFGNPSSLHKIGMNCEKG